MRDNRMAKTYPWWMAMVDPQDWDEMRQAVRELLTDLPLPQQELAAEIGVDPSTVSRWTAGKTIPSPSELRGVLQVLESQLARLRARVEWGGQLLDAVDGVVHPRKAAFKGLMAARENLHELLRGSKAKRTGPRRRKRK